MKNIQHLSLLRAWAYIQCRAHVEAIPTLRFLDEEPHSAGEEVVFLLNVFHNESLF